MGCLCRAFGGDTEAGRLLKKLYCGTTKPQVNYPSALSWLSLVSVCL
jgi:hypothetical protein